MAKSKRFPSKLRFQSSFRVIWLIQSNMHAPVLLNFLKLLRKRDKMLDKPHMLSLFPNLFDKFIRT